jgi:hypothetical protein
MPTEPAIMKGSSAGGPQPLHRCSRSPFQLCMLRTRLNRGVCQSFRNPSFGPQAASSRAS